jgi:hypothetical protein
MFASAQTCFGNVRNCEESLSLGSMDWEFRDKRQFWVSLCTFWHFSNYLMLNICTGQAQAPTFRWQDSNSKAIKRKKKHIDSQNCFGLEHQVMLHPGAQTMSGFSLLVHLPSSLILSTGRLSLWSQKVPEWPFHQCSNPHRVKGNCHVKVMGWMVLEWVLAKVHPGSIHWGQRDEAGQMASGIPRLPWSRSLISVPRPHGMRLLERLGELQQGNAGNWHHLKMRKGHIRWKQPPAAHMFHYNFKGRGNFRNLQLVRGQAQRSRTSHFGWQSKMQRKQVNQGRKIPFCFLLKRTQYCICWLS